jgi:hypothetical protein
MVANLTGALPGVQHASALTARADDPAAGAAGSLTAVMVVTM